MHTCPVTWHTHSQQPHSTPANTMNVSIDTSSHPLQGFHVALGLKSENVSNLAKLQRDSDFQSGKEALPSEGGTKGGILGAAW